MHSFPIEDLKTLYEMHDFYLKKFKQFIFVFLSLTILLFVIRTCQYLNSNDLSLWYSSRLIPVGVILLGILKTSSINMKIFHIGLYIFYLFSFISVIEVILGSTKTQVVVYMIVI